MHVGRRSVAQTVQRAPCKPANTFMHTPAHTSPPAPPHLAGKTVRELQFRDQFNGVVVAISRQGERIQVGVSSPCCPIHQLA